MGVQQDYWVTPHEVGLAANRTNLGAATVRDNLAMLRNYVLTTQEYWTGSAQQQFLLLMHDFDLVSNRLNQALENIGLAMHGNRVNYEETEQANLRNLVKVGIDLPNARF